MPVGDLPGWTQVFADDFDGTSLDMSKWYLYYGQPGGDPGGWWDGSHVVVHDGIVELQTYQDPAHNGNTTGQNNDWVSGGMGGQGIHQTYGKYFVRFRMEPGYGLSYVALLWPVDNSWPPEVDFAEQAYGTTATTYATLHYGSNNTMIENSVNADFTQWHTVGVEWTAGKLVYTLDGNVWGTVTNPNVPTIPMELDLQTQTYECGNTWSPCPNASTPSHVNMQIDWVVAYSQ
jgi:beta-glucanase (GH16 family)